MADVATYPPLLLCRTALSLPYGRTWRSEDIEDRAIAENDGLMVKEVVS